MYQYGISIFIVEKSRVTLYEQKTKHVRIPANRSDNSIALHPVWYNALATFSIQHYPSLLVGHRRPPIYASYVASSLIAPRRWTKQQCKDAISKSHDTAYGTLLLSCDPCHDTSSNSHKSVATTGNSSCTQLVETFMLGIKTAPIRRKSTNTNTVVRWCPVCCTPPLVHRQVKYSGRNRSAQSATCISHDSRLGSLWS